MAQLGEPRHIIPGHPRFGDPAVRDSVDTDDCHLE